MGLSISHVPPSLQRRFSAETCTSFWGLQEIVLFFEWRVGRKHEWCVSLLTLAWKQARTLRLGQCFWYFFYPGWRQKQLNYLIQNSRMTRDWSRVAMHFIPDHSLTQLAKNQCWFIWSTLSRCHVKEINVAVSRLSLWIGIPLNKATYNK